MKPAVQKLAGSNSKSQLLLGDLILEKFAPRSELEVLLVFISVMSLLCLCLTDSPTLLMADQAAPSAKND